MLLLWAGIFFLVLGITAIGVDRRAAHLIYDRVGAKLNRFLYRTTHLAKAAHWLAFSVAVYIGCWIALRSGHNAPWLKLAFQSALAYVLALGAGTVVIHSIKFFLGRRRPRDEIEMGLYGFIPFAFDLKKNSFPSGHSLTIFCVAVIATALWPIGAPVWFGVALWLSLTRALMTAHFLSDVFVGAGIGLIVSREIVANWFPALTLSWF